MVMELYYFECNLYLYYEYYDGYQYQYESEYGSVDEYQDGDVNGLLSMFTSYDYIHVKHVDHCEFQLKFISSVGLVVISDVTLVVVYIVVNAVAGLSSSMMAIIYEFILSHDGQQAQSSWFYVLVDDCYDSFYI